MNAFSFLIDDLESHLFEIVAFLFNDKESVFIAVNNMFNKFIVNVKIIFVFQLYFLKFFNLINMSFLFLEHELFGLWFNL